MHIITLLIFDKQSMFWNDKVWTFEQQLGFILFTLVSRLALGPFLHPT